MNEIRHQLDFCLFVGCLEVMEGYLFVYFLDKVKELLNEGIRKRGSGRIGA